ncbi:helix-turn-helix domain-containing protein [Kordia sp. TARA_039_SRF]|nr:helix-turn-helix domain-containing protein [Kordia sp. TARA_039_SRF]
MRFLIVLINLFFIFLLSFPVYAQDSLDTLNLEILSKKINSTVDTTLRFMYINKFIGKAQKENNLLSVKAGYYYKYNYTKNDSLKISSLDSILKISEKESDPIFTPIGHIGKAIFYREKRNFKKALDALIEANEYAKETNDKRCFFQSNHQIGILKDRIGNYDEALKIHKENIEFAKNHTDVISQENYLHAIFALSFTYKNLNKLDSASHYNDFGIKETQENEFKDLYHYFILNKGIILFLKNDLDQAKNYLELAKTYFTENQHLPNTAEANFYLAKTELEFNNEEKAILHLKKVDSIFDKMKDLIPEIRETYYILSEYYEEKKDLKNQLKYIQKLIQSDSILNSNYIYINENLKFKYDIPKYTAEKEELIRSLEIQNKSRSYYFLSVVFLAVVIIIYLVIRQITLKKRFNSLINSQSDKQLEISKNTIEGEELDIPKDILNKIIQSIENFEKNNEFTDSQITLISLAKEFNTNTTYLSKTINYLKNKNLNTYLNELRVNYAIEKIKKDSRFRKYTIKAISVEVGFKSPQTFSKTFTRITGLKPSYFIKQIEKSQKP